MALTNASDWLPARVIQWVTWIDARNPALARMLPASVKRRIAAFMLRPARGRALTIDGSRLEFPSLTSGIWFSNHPEIGVRRLFRQLVRPGDHVADVGANVGLHTTLLAELVGREGRVHAFEPSAANFHCLRRNLHPFGPETVVLHNCALGSYERRSRLYLRGGGGANSLYPDRDGSDSSRVSEVLVRTLDDTVPERLDLIKMDVEGAEVEVLSGMPRHLENPSIEFVFEWHCGNQAASGRDPLELLWFFREREFDLWLIKEEEVVPFSLEEAERIVERWSRKNDPGTIYDLLSRRRYAAET